jgi:hypothetical protein
MNKKGRKSVTDSDAESTKKRSVFTYGFLKINKLNLQTLKPLKDVTINPGDIILIDEGCQWTILQTIIMQGAVALRFKKNAKNMLEVSSDLPWKILKKYINAFTPEKIKPRFIFVTSETLNIMGAEGLNTYCLSISWDSSNFDFVPVYGKFLN